jgi:hypothetical protein
VGFGRWGILFREFLEIWEQGKYDGKWERTIDGVEIFVPYIKITIHIFTIISLKKMRLSSSRERIITMIS